MKPSGVLLVDIKPASGPLRRALEAAGHIVREEDSAGGALQMLGREPMALVLFNYQLPDMDAREFVARVRGLPGGGALSILALVSPLDAVNPAPVAALDLTDYLVQPVDIPRLISVINSYMPIGWATTASGETDATNMPSGRYQAGHAADSASASDRHSDSGQKQHERTEGKVDDVNEDRGPVSGGN